MTPEFFKIPVSNDKSILLRSYPKRFIMAWLQNLMSRGRDSLASVLVSGLGFGCVRIIAMPSGCKLSTYCRVSCSFVILCVFIKSRT